MRRVRHFYSVLFVAALASPCFVLPALGQTPNREHFENAEVLYDWVTNHRGEKLRTFITHPKATPGKVPGIFFVGWLSCDSMEYPDPNTRDGFGIFMRRLIEKSGFATARMDKPGVGESQGQCSKADFQSEIEGWQAAFDSLGKYDFIDRDRIFVVGSAMAAASRRWRLVNTRCADSYPPGPGDAPGTNTCWNWNDDA
jgi:hypothetical protein